MKMSEGSERPRGPYDGEVEVITDCEQIVDRFIELLHENGEYWELMKPLIRFRTGEDAYQWVFGRDIDCSDVDINEAVVNGEKALLWVSFDPDGRTYSNGGKLIAAYTEVSTEKRPRTLVQTDSPITDTMEVNRMEIHKHE